MGRHQTGFQLRNDLSELETLRTELERFKVKADIPEKTLLEINLILDELFTNIVSCGYRDGEEHWVKIALCRERDVLTLCVRDDGVPFNPTELPEPDRCCPMEERRIGGMGILLIRRLTDEMTYHRTDTDNVVTLRKNLPQPIRT